MGLKMKSGAYVGTRGSITSVIEFKTKQEAVNGDYNAPPKASERIKSYFKTTVKNQYLDLKVAKAKNGNYIALSYNPGRVEGSYAVYVKIISPKGETISVYKDTYDNNGKFVHRKFKYGSEAAE